MYNPVMIGEVATTTAPNDSVDTSQLSDVSTATSESNEVGEESSTSETESTDSEMGMSKNTMMYIGLGLLAYFLLFRKK